MKDEKLEAIEAGRAGRKLTREDLKVAIAAIREAGGDVIAVSGMGPDRDDDWCGTVGRIPWPPKPKVIDVLNLAGHGWVIDWFPYGIPVIDHVHVRLRDRALVQRG